MVSLKEFLDHGPHPPTTFHATNYHHQAGSYAFFMPRVSFLGPDCMSAAPNEIKKLGIKKALLITGHHMVKAPEMKVVEKVLAGCGVECVVYDGSTPNPTDKEVEEGVALLKENGCDSLVSFGGGSPHDLAKAIGIVAANGGKIQDYEGLDKSEKEMLPLVCFNTTAGTAAEMTRFSIITDTTRHVKMAIVDSKCTPAIAIDDPRLMTSMPKGLTAATGMDALTHAIEAYVSTASNPVTDACALHAIRLISTYLRDAVHDPTNMRARDFMSYAQYLAGMAFNNASLGYVHACAHQLGGMYDLPHGVCNAVLLPVIQEFNAKAVPDLFVDMAEAMGVGSQADSAELAVQKLLAAIRELSQDVGIPKNLKELGVKPEDFGTLADNAMKDCCGLTNPIQPNREEVIELFQKAYEQ